MNFQTELQTAQQELAAIPLQAASTALEKAQARFDKARAAPDGTNEAKERTSAEIELIGAKVTYEHTFNAADKVQRRIDDLTRVMACTDRLDAVNVTIGALNAKLAQATKEANHTDAAAAKLETLQVEAQQKLHQYTADMAAQLMLDAGMTGDAVVTPKGSDVAKVQNELKAVQIAIEKARERQVAQQQAVTQLQAELSAAQAELLDAEADRLAVIHAEALATYLPTLAELRRAESAARGYFSASVDVEMMARAMLASAH